MPESSGVFPPDLAQSKTYDEALRGLVDHEFLGSQTYQEQDWRANWAGADPRIREFARIFCMRMWKLGVPVYVHCAVRTAEEQLRLFQEGKSKDSPADGLWPHRKHAVDIVHGVRHWNLTDKEWKLLGHHGQQVAGSLSIPVEWGGVWKFYDPAHWEIKGWKALP